MTEDTKVSIILPTFNGVRYLKRAIGSVLAQSFSNWELIIIDDGSSDNTQDIAKEYSNKDSRIIFLKNDKNLGLQKTLNRGMKEAKGKYIARIDDDDEWIDKDKLKKQVEFLDNNPGYVLVGTGVVVVNEKDEEMSRYLLPKTDREIKDNLLSKNCFTHSSILFDKDTALKVGGYDELESTKHVEDYDLYLKIGMLGKFFNLPEYLTAFTARAASISSKNKMEQFKKNIKLTRKYKNNYPNYNVSLAINYSKIIFYNFFAIIPNPFKNIIFKLYKEF